MSGAARRVIWVTLAVVARCAAALPAAQAQSPGGQPALVPGADALDSDPDLAPPRPASHRLRSFEQALTLVRARSPEVLAADAEVQRAAARARSALAALLPRLDALGSITHELITTQQVLGDRPVTIPSQDVWGAAATLSLPLADAHAIHELATAHGAVRAAESARVETRREVMRAIVDAVVGEVAAERLADQNRGGLRAALERLSLTRQKLDLGGARALDVDRAEQDLLETRKLVVTGDEALFRARESLGSVLGSADATALGDGFELAGLERALAAHCRLEPSIEQRADVATARTRLDLAERAIGAVDLQFLPTLSLGSALAWDSGVVYGPNTTWNVRAILSVPIWDGGDRYGRRREAQALAAQARAELAAVRTRALIDAAQSERAVAVAARARELAERERALALQVDQRTRTGYAQGLGTSLDLVTSAQALRRAQLEYTVLDLRAAHARMLAILARAECD